MPTECRLFCQHVVEFYVHLAHVICMSVGAWDSSHIPSMWTRKKSWGGLNLKNIFFWILNQADDYFFRQEKCYGVHSTCPQA